MAEANGDEVHRAKAHTNEGQPAPSDTGPGSARKENGGHAEAGGGVGQEERSSTDGGGGDGGADPSSGGDGSGAAGSGHVSGVPAGKAKGSGGYAFSLSLAIEEGVYAASRAVSNRVGRQQATVQLDEFVKLVDEHVGVSWGVSEVGKFGAIEYNGSPVIIREGLAGPRGQTDSEIEVATDLKTFSGAATKALWSGKMLDGAEVDYSEGLRLAMSEMRIGIGTNFGWVGGLILHASTIPVPWKRFIVGAIGDLFADTHDKSSRFYTVWKGVGAYQAAEFWPIQWEKIADWPTGKILAYLYGFSAGMTKKVVIYRKPTEEEAAMQRRIARKMTQEGDEDWMSLPPSVDSFDGDLSPWWGGGDSSAHDAIERWVAAVKREKDAIIDARQLPKDERSKRLLEIKDVESEGRMNAELDKDKAIVDLKERWNEKLNASESLMAIARGTWEADCMSAWREFCSSFRKMGVVSNSIMFHLGLAFPSVKVGKETKALACLQKLEINMFRCGKGMRYVVGNISPWASAFIEQNKVALSGLEDAIPEDCIHLSTFEDCERKSAACVVSASMAVDRTMAGFKDWKGTLEFTRGLGCLPVGDPDQSGSVVTQRMQMQQAWTGQVARAVEALTRVTVECADGYQRADAPEALRFWKLVVAVSPERYEPSFWRCLFDTRYCGKEREGPTLSRTRISGQFSSTGVHVDGNFGDMTQLISNTDPRAMTEYSLLSDDPVFFTAPGTEAYQDLVPDLVMAVVPGPFVCLVPDRHVACYFQPEATGQTERRTIGTVPRIMEHGSQNKKDLYISCPRGVPSCVLTSVHSVCTSIAFSAQEQSATATVAYLCGIFDEEGSASGSQ
jgi:hypothetical protein